MTAYRFQQVTTVGVGNIADILDDRTQPVMFLTSVEATLGVLNACLPVLKPVFRKVRDSVPKPNWWKGTKTSIKSGSIPIFMRVSQMWQSSSGGRSRRDGLDSIISMENLTRSESAIQSSSKVDNVLGTKGSEIHVQRDIVVESTSIEV